MFIRSNNRIHPHFHTTDNISSFILRAPAGGYCMERANRRLCFVRFVAFSMLPSKRGDASQYSNWLRHLSVWFIHFSAFRLSLLFIFLLIRFHVFFLHVFLSLFLFVLFVLLSLSNSKVIVYCSVCV